MTIFMWAFDKSEDVDGESAQSCGQVIPRGGPPGPPDPPGPSGPAIGILNSESATGWAKAIVTSASASLARPVQEAIAFAASPSADMAGNGARRTATAATYFQSSLVRSFDSHFVSALRTVAVHFREVDMVGDAIGLFASIPFVIALLRVRLRDSSKIAGYLYPPLGDFQPLAFDATIGTLLLSLLVVCASCESARRVLPRTYFILALG